MQLQHVIKLKLSSQLIGQFGHVTASASCKQPEKHQGLIDPRSGERACNSAYACRARDGGYYSAERNGTERTGYVERALLIISRVFAMGYN